MSLTLITKSTATLVSIAEIRAQCRLSDDEHLEDALLAGYIRTAQDWIEQELGGALLTSTWEYRIGWFPTGPTPWIRIPMTPLISVDQISYVDTAGASQVLPMDQWQVVGGRIWPVYGKSWPATRCPSDIIIRFTAGYGPDHNAVPEPVRQAVMLLATYYFGQREAVLVGPHNGPASDAPFGVRQLLWPYRAWAF